MSLPLLHATRAISGHSVPIITFMAFCAGAIIRAFGPESIGGRGLGDSITKIDAEAARTGVPSEEISNRVHTSVYILDELTDFVSKDNEPRRKTHLYCWPSCNARLRIFPAASLAYLT